MRGERTMWVIRTTVQETKPPTVVMLVNQVKTVAPELDKFRKDRQPMANVAKTATQGIPRLLHVLKILGAWPVHASE